MASNVVVIDSSARRATIKTMPNKYLSDVLQEACSKLGLTASNYGLKHNNKDVDLSRTIRLSGLSPGAKLELVQASKSAGVVSVALQLPDSDAQGVPNARLTDKFPSTTTLWQILRKFEAGVAGGGAIGPNATFHPMKRNLTARGVPGTKGANSGAGRLYYQRPVLQVMGRDLTSFTDLQKTLAQLGFNNGSTLLKLSFRTSETPLEEAMTEIEEYFQSVDGPASIREPPNTSNAVAETTSEAGRDSSKIAPEWTSDEANIPASSSETAPALTAPLSDAPTSPTTSRPLSVFLPPSSSTPSAATSHPFNPADYTPTIEHAKTHQRMLSQSTSNVRLPSEAEIAAAQEAEREKLAGIKDVEIKVRFPDESSVIVKFGQTDTGKGLYDFVRECLDSQWAGEKFVLRNPGFRGAAAKGKSEIVPDSEVKRLIRDLGLKGRVLVVFSWDEDADPKAKVTKAVLKAELRQVARKIEVSDVSGLGPVEEEDRGVKVDVGKKDADAGDGEKRKGGVPKWLKGLSKK